jgi:hypothetical protein
VPAERTETTAAVGDVGVRHEEAEHAVESDSSEDNEDIQEQGASESVGLHSKESVSPVSDNSGSLGVLTRTGVWHAIRPTDQTRTLCGLYIHDRFMSAMSSEHIVCISCTKSSRNSASLE